MNHRVRIEWRVNSQPSLAYITGSDLQCSCGYRRFIPTPCSQIDIACEVIFHFMDIEERNRRAAVLGKWHLTPNEHGMWLLRNGR